MLMACQEAEIEANASFLDLKKELRVSGFFPLQKNPKTFFLRGKQCSEKKC